MAKEKTIRSSIRKGNMLILGGGLFLTVFFTACLIYVFFCQQQAVHYSDNLALASDSIIEADKIYRKVDEIVYSASKTATTDFNTPSFDSLCKEAAADSKEITKELTTTQKKYSEFISAAQNALTLNSTSKTKAQSMVDGDVAPLLDELVDDIHKITRTYAEMTETAGSQVSGAITISIIIGAVFLIALLIYSLQISARMGRTIADPVVAVAEWAETLSTGADQIESMHTSPNIDLSEIKRMVKAFTLMSEGIKDNVDVVRKVADGDMTAYVNIRSSKDSLGKSLYKMVQSNDIMFAQITQIADSVTEGTDSISSAAKLLAESCTEQATAIANFQKDISETNALVKENAADAAQASVLSDSIRSEVVVSKEKMQELVAAMKAIYDASAKVSGVISNIESLANQTNLLAINATIEAKRAGEAGKSFAVVASSVKDLADKSAVSATQTKALIDDTIAKAKRGSQLSDETFATFGTIMETLEQITEVSGKIAESGAKQQENMSDIELQVDEISRAVSTNAASSEETAAMTVEISRNAEVLKASMKQFNLRNRTPGKPYIPPEKKNDAEFVRVATENYNKFLKSAEGRKIAKELNTDKI
ncbi:MAG: hypothetical protein K2N56_09265 [Oscillospiraceae bacterium]|nr:hypothetical protein [Oscillospiraceae bacterium]